MAVIQEHYGVIVELFGDYEGECRRMDEDLLLLGAGQCNSLVN